MEIQNLHKFSDRVWYMDPTVDTDRPALGYIKGDKFSVMVDSGNSPEHVKLFFNKLEEAGLPLPSLCLITHWHWDHTLGIAGLSIPSICSKRTAERLSEGIDFAEMYDSNEFVRAEYSSPDDIKLCVPELVFDKTICINVGGVSVKFIFVGGPHSDDGAIVFVPEEKFIFGGDSSSGNFDLPKIAYDLDLLNEHEEILRGIEFETYLHAHRPIMTREEFFSFLDAGRKRGYYTFD